MTVRELIQRLRAFDDELPAAVDTGEQLSTVTDVTFWDVPAVAITHDPSVPLGEKEDK